HLEIESLPSGGWGYNHFPLFVRYFQTQPLPHLGHTGRFHRSWGDFGGLKPRAALEYECFRMLASGSTCCVGDQLHPRGRLGPAPFQPEYLHRDGRLADAAPPMEHVVYERGERVEPLAGAEVLARVGEPYFNRTPFMYMSHEHAPVRAVTDAPAVVRSGRVA